MIKLKDLLNEVNFRRFKVYVSGESEPLVLFGKDIKDAMQVARKMMQNSNKKITKVVKEEKLTEGKVDKSFTKIIGLLRKESRRLNDDDSYELSTKLKAWFNKNIL